MPSLFKIFLSALTLLTFVVSKGQSKQTEVLLSNRSYLIVENLELEKSFSFKAKPFSPGVAHNSIREKEKSNSYYRPMAAHIPKNASHDIHNPSLYYKFAPLSLRDQLILTAVDFLVSPLRGGAPSYRDHPFILY
jgi:hypothetical protein